MQTTLADFAPVSSPKIPSLVIYCIKEIEHRGLHEVRKILFKSLFTCTMTDNCFLISLIIRWCGIKGNQAIRAVLLLLLSVPPPPGWPVQSLWPRAHGERAEGETVERKDATSA